MMDVSAVWNRRWGRREGRGEEKGVVESAEGVGEGQQKERDNAAIFAIESPILGRMKDN